MKTNRFVILMVALFSPAAMAQSNPGNATDGYNISYDIPNTSFLKCTDYPDVGNPKDPNFKPDKHRWPAFGGIRQNQSGPYNKNAKCYLPHAGITVGGGQYGWGSAGLVVTASKDQMEDSKQRRKYASKAQKNALLHLEASNPNWTYSFNANGIRMTPIDFDPQCLYRHANFVTKDGKSYYHNFYRYLGIIPEDAKYIPTIHLKDYLTPTQLRKKLADMGCLLEAY